jgi:hypothetical protein
VGQTVNHWYYLKVVKYQEKKPQLWRKTPHSSIMTAPAYALLLIRDFSLENKKKSGGARSGE